MLLPVIWFENLGPAAPGAAEVRFHAAPLTDQYEGWKKEGKGQQREEYRVCKGECLLPRTLMGQSPGFRV